MGGLGLHPNFEATAVAKINMNSDTVVWKHTSGKMSEHWSNNRKIHELLWCRVDMYFL